MGFIEEHFERVGFDIEAVIPRIKVKYREQLCFSGKKIDYADFTKFVRRDNIFIPMLDVKEVKDTDKIIDMSPFINVGIAEMVSLTSGEHNDVNVEFFRYLVSLNVFQIYEDAIDIVHKILLSSEFDNENNLGVINSLRSTYVNCTFPEIQRIIAALTVIQMVNPKLYCQVILESMKYSYTICSAFTADLDNLFCGQFSDLDATQTSVNKAVSARSLRTGAIGYTIPSKSQKHYITDSRGVGIYSYIKLLHTVYANFGEALSNRTISIGQDKEATREKIDKNLADCIGDDYVSFYLRNGKLKSKPCDERYGTLYKQFDISPFDSHEEYTLSNGTKVSRQMYEDKKLFLRAHGVGIQSGINEVNFGDFNTYYTSLCSIASVVTLFTACNEMYCIDIDEVRKQIAKLEAAKTIGAIVSKSENKVDTSKYERQIEDLNKTHEKETESYEARIKELEHQLESKSNIIAKLSDEVKTLSTEIESYYTEVDIDGTLEDVELSIEEIISYLNNFKICLVGGRMGLDIKLKELGLTNIVQVDSERAINGTPTQCDFFCINTAFLAHRLTNMVRERYKDQISQFYYFNGTNVEALLRVSYDFIKGWMEK